MDMFERALAVGHMHNASRKDADIYLMRREYNAHFCDTPHYEPDTTVNEVRQELLVYPFRQYNEIKVARTRPGESIDLGDVVAVYGSRWLVTELDPDRKLCCKAKLELCNRKIGWQDKTDFALHERWCIVKKPYFSNLEERYKLELSAREYKIILPYDGDSAQVDIGHRLILEIVGQPKSYRITSVDGNTLRQSRDEGIKGLLIWNVLQDQYNPETDDAELMIADYTQPPVKEHETGAHAVIQQEGRPEVCIGSPSFKYFLVTAVDEGGTPIPPDELDIRLKTADELSSFVEVRQAEGTVGIRFTRQMPRGSGCWLYVYHNGRNEPLCSTWIKAVSLI